MPVHVAAARPVSSTARTTLNARSQQQLQKLLGVSVKYASASANTSASP